jgi:hypothetical protein
MAKLSHGDPVRDADEVSAGDGRNEEEPALPCQLTEMASFAKPGMNTPPV